MLLRLLWEHPKVGEVVLSTREERQREIEATEEAARAKARAKEEEALREMEAPERARAEAEQPRQSVVTVAKATKRAAFSVTAYVSPTPHLFVSSRFFRYKL
ncbi:hypothetical protein RHMOL_Rhmol11G0041900 [Rhododendron molle]|uniref:Uncharacterized protein n=1 Tax=Rhododendron molle TaxID=49168 RepID=A0ACC0LNY0_RHOML|nr:hypothetical protein RHMOL_Rhmol11G0041900 [Rhododendron molle]